jgi:chemotaxis protein MotB
MFGMLCSGLLAVRRSSCAIGLANADSAPRKDRCYSVVLGCSTESRDGRRSLLLAAVVSLAFVSGCSFVPKSQFETAQSQNRVLLEQKKAQLAEIENLKIHAHNVEDQLIKAEEELARLDQQQRDGRRMAAADGQYGALRGGQLPAGISGRLADLARRYPYLQFEPESGASKVDTDVLFDSGQAALKPDAEQMLTELADVFRSEEARGLKIMVVGHTDSQNIRAPDVRRHYPTNWHLSAGRALSVADYLRRAGIPEDRMGVAGFGQFQPVSPNDTASTRQKNRRVEIYLLGPETPIVGWANPHAGIYR